MIVVTGATGKLGGMVVERLLERLPADAVGVGVRDPQRAAALADHRLELLSQIRHLHPLLGS